MYLFLPTGETPYGPDMAHFEVTMKDRSVERIGAVDAYRQEGPMTTFFRTDGGHRPVDSWSTRVASYRTAEILIIRRHDDPVPASAEVTALEPRRTA